MCVFVFVFVFVFGFGFCELCLFEVEVCLFGFDGVFGLEFGFDVGLEVEAVGGAMIGTDRGGGPGRGKGKGEGDRGNGCDGCDCTRL